MVSQKVVIKNPTGLHLRPAGILCKEAMQYKSSITFMYRGNTANAKSVLSVLGACIKCGDEIEFICNGIDEEQALKAYAAQLRLCRFLLDAFDGFRQNNPKQVLLLLLTIYRVNGIIIKNGAYR